MRRLSVLAVATTIAIASGAHAQASHCLLEESGVSTTVSGGVVHQQVHAAAEGCNSYEALVDAFIRTMVDVQNGLAIHVAALGTAPVRLVDPQTSRNIVRMEPVMIDAAFASFRKPAGCAPELILTRECLRPLGPQMFVTPDKFSVMTASE